MFNRHALININGVTLKVKNGDYIRVEDSKLTHIKGENDTNIYLFGDKIEPKVEPEEEYYYIIYVSISDEIYALPTLRSKWRSIESMKERYNEDEESSAYRNENNEIVVLGSEEEAINYIHENIKEECWAKELIYKAKNKCSKFRKES